MEIEEHTIRSLGDLIDSVTPAEPDPTTGRLDPAVLRLATGVVEILQVPRTQTILWLRLRRRKVRLAWGSRGVC